MLSRAAFRPRAPLGGPLSAAPDAARERALLLAAALTSAVAYAVVVRDFFRVEEGIGYDYAYFFPRLLDLAWWRRGNGLLAPPWFSPSFCGGLPIFADGQDLSFALPGLLASWVDPLEAAYLTAVTFALLGALGFAALLRRGFGASLPTAVLGGVVLAFNGAHDARTFAGHLAYHGMMLVPWVCLGVVEPLPEEPRARRRRLASDVLVVAFGLGYIAWCGLINMSVPLGLAVLAVALVHGLARGGGWRDKALRLGAGGLLALALGAGKLTAFSAYFSHFRRDLYPLPGIPGLGHALRAALVAVFGWAPPAHTAVANSRWAIESHEWDYSVGPLPALGLAVGFGLWARGRRWVRVTRGHVLPLLALIAVLAVPFVVNVYSPGWNRFLKGLPVFASSSHLLRWWLTYVFVAPIGLLSLEALHPSRRTAAAAFGMLLTVAMFTAKSRPHNRNFHYFPESVIAAWHDTRARGTAPPVTHVSLFKAATPQRNSALTRQESQLFCYEPAFGYGLGRFPRGSLHVGPVSDLQDGAFNLKNPACYLWPRENHCRPGDPFSAAQRDAAAAFAARRPFHFAVSTRQRVGEFVMAGAWIAALSALSALALSRVRRLREAPPDR